MELAVGSIHEGKVTGITKFGAFVTLSGGKSGLVHISEVANTFVNDVHEHLQIGQDVKVKILNITDDGKLNLSIKRAEERPQQDRPQRRSAAPARENTSAPVQQPVQQAARTSGNQSFEDRLKKFMQESDSRIADNKIYSEHRQRSRRR